MIRITSLNPFYSPIAFSLTCEDIAVAEQGLDIQPGERAVCVGSGGDTPLSLLRNEASLIEAVDVSFPQVCEITLKAEAIRRLDLADVRLLLGVDPDRRRAVAIYRRLRGSLPPSVAAFWDTHEWMIARGLLWQGGVQRLICAARALIAVLFGRASLQELRSLPTPGAAVQFVERLGRDWRFRVITALVLNRLTVAAFYPQSAWRDLRSAAARRQFLLERLERMLVARPPGASPQLHPFLFDSFPTDQVLPPYLQQSQFARVKASIDRLRVVHADLVHHLETLPPSSVACFGLLNVVDWLNAERLRDLLRAVARCGSPGARLLTYARSKPLDTAAAAVAGLNVDEFASARLEALDGLRYYRHTYLLRLQHRVTAAPGRPPITLVSGGPVA